MGAALTKACYSLITMKWNLITLNPRRAQTHVTQEIIHWCLVLICQLRIVLKFRVVNNRTTLRVVSLPSLILEWLLQTILFLYVMTSLLPTGIYTTLPSSAFTWKCIDSSNTFWIEECKAIWNTLCLTINSQLA